MRKVLVIVFLVSLVFNGVSHMLLPDEVAIHFGRGGQPNSWASKELNMAISIVTDVVMFGIFFFLPTLLAKTPKKWINLPNKDYWLSEENVAITQGKLSGLMSEFGVAIFIFIILVKALALKANLSDPVRLDERVFLIGLGTFMVFTFFWCVKLYISFRLPPTR